MLCMTGLHDHDSSPAVITKSGVQRGKKNDYLAEKPFSNVNVYTSPRTLLKCSFSFNRFGMGPELLHFL